MDSHQHNMKKADPDGQEKTPNNPGTAVPTAPLLDTVEYHPQYGAVASAATPYPHQSYQPLNPGVDSPTLEQPPPYPGPPQPGYQQPYSPPGYQQPPQQSYQQFHNVDNTTPQPPDPNPAIIVRTGQADAGSIPKDYYCLSVCAIFCCPLFGVIACCYSSRVGKLLFEGRYAEARSYSARAKGWSIVAISIGLISLFAYAITLSITLTI